MNPLSFKALLVSENNKEYTSSITERTIEQLAENEVIIEVHYSSLNYKDALSAKGNKGVSRNFPHTPGIDASGIVKYSNSPDWKEGDKVLVTGFDLGMNTHGGFAQYVKVPSQWVVALPDGLSLREAMIYGTAGFTAALSVQSLLLHGIRPEDGVVAVTGATGGVGSVAVAILAKLGYNVAAVSSKTSAEEFLKKIGAASIIPRAEVEDVSGKPLLKPRFAAAIDTVGGAVLATLVKSVQYGGTVTACGLVNGTDLALTVFPFILKGITLSGIDSVELPMAKRLPVWENMATVWKPVLLEEMAQEIGLEELPLFIDKIFAGNMEGRALVRILA